MKGITLNYETSKVVNFADFRKMILEDNKRLHVHNPRNINRKHGDVVVSEPEKMSTKLSLRRACLWTPLITLHKDIINLLTSFIYFS